MNIDKQFLTADNLIVSQFYLNNYNIANPTSITAADLLINDSFYAENNS
jgi:hypothetical protein